MFIVVLSATYTQCSGVCQHQLGGVSSAVFVLKAWLVVLLLRLPTKHLES